MNGPINEEAMGKGLVDLGGVPVTDADDLDADYVIHAAAMPHYGDGRTSSDIVRRATRNALAAADERGCESLVVPVLGTGAAGLDFETGPRFVCEEVHDQEPGTLTDVRVIMYTESEYRTMQAVA